MNPQQYPTCKTLFFAGTDTDVGKTYIAASAARQIHQAGYRVGVYKPVASGCRRADNTLIADDAERLWEAAGRPLDREQVCPQRFEAPLAPPEAARLESRQVDPRQLVSGAAVWQRQCDWLIVEGAGGLMSPLAEGVLNVDLAKSLAPIRLIIVAANRLGVVHQTLATVEAALHRDLLPFGIILNTVSDRSDSSTATNRRQISAYTDIPVLGEVEFRDFRLDDSTVDQLIGGNRVTAKPPDQ